MPNTREKLIDAIEKEKPYIPTEDYEVGYNNGLTMAQTIILATDINDGHKWIPVTERLPEDDEVVLIACKIGKMFVGYHKHLFPGCEVWRILTARDSTKKITYTVTHWMPLPEAPKGE